MCPWCRDRRSGDGLLCQGAGSCTERLERALGEVTALVDAAMVTYTRRARLGSGGGRRDETPLPYDPRVTQLLRELEAAVDAIVNRFWMPSDAWRAERTVGQRALFTCSHVLLLRRFVDDAQLAWYDQLLDRSERLWQLVDRPTHRMFIGTCTCGVAQEVDAELVGDPARSVPTQPQVTCPSCGETWDTQGSIDRLREAVDDQELTAIECSRALTHLQRPVTPERIRKWAERGRLASVGFVDVGAGRCRPIYRVRDVRVLLEVHEARIERIRAARSEA